MVEGTVKNVTVSMSGTKWFVSVQTERDVPDPVPVGSAVGLDMGVVRFVTISDGRWVEPLDSFKKHQLRLARYQCRMARKQKFSRNWYKAKAKVTQLHSTIANARKDFLHVRREVAYKSCSHRGKGENRPCHWVNLGA
jgi:putative transposase